MAEVTQTLAQRWPRVALQAAVPAIVAGLLARKGHAVPASIIGGIAAFSLVSGLMIPRLFARWEAMGAALAKGVGVALTWLCLVPTFFLVFVPARLILLLSRNDPMCRAFPTRLPTYWVPRPPVKDPSEYRRQF